MKTILAILLVATLSGCAAPKQYTQEEWEKYSTRFYKDKTPDEIIKAATKLFLLSDPDDYEFITFENSLEAIRRKFFLMSVTHDKWILKTYPKENGTKAILGYIWNDGSSPGLMKDVGTYDLFWKRMDYLLGLSKEWITCDKHSKDYSGKKTIDPIGIGLCWHDADDNSPDN
jgi:hypothetical protein